ncbi:MAG: hypothetical protein K0S33_3886 [Bacteroidetes bacterium]|jgi:hypothetical protein|nr:hypothetical protein [Bacteroidota bacterium]
MKKLFLSLFVLSFSLSAFSKNFEEAPTKENLTNSANRVNNSSLSVQVPKYIFSGLNTNIDLVFNNPSDEKLITNNNDLFFIINGEDVKIHFDKNGVGSFNHTFNENENLSIYFEDFNYSANLHIIPIWYVVVPVSLLVILLSYKLFRSGRKNKTGSKMEVPESQSEEGNDAEIAAAKPKVKIRKVVEKEEEIFA